jgi:hypothetical protein
MKNPFSFYKFLGYAAPSRGGYSKSKGGKLRKLKNN